MIETLQTPFFLIREELLRANIDGFRAALDRYWPNSIIAYSEKTNCLPWILRWMKARGVYAEVVSDEEYELALLSGYTDGEIVFNGPIKGRETLLRAIGGGAFVNIDSERELALILEEKPSDGERLGLRVNVDPALFDPNDVGFQEDGFRFGFSEEMGGFSRALEALAQVYGHRRFGLHMHVNSVTRAPEIYKAIAALSAKLIKKYDLTPAYIDIGGGFFGGVPGKTTPEEYIRTIRDQLADAVDISRTTLILEPGSAAIGSAIELHTTVLDVKDTLHARIVTTDGSRIYIDPLWLKKSYLYSSSAQGDPVSRQVVCGYTCMDRDRLMVLQGKPALAPGDRIVYQRVGNYTVTFGGAFIRPLPAVYAIRDGKLELARRAMSTADYFRMETGEE